MKQKKLNGDFISTPNGKRFQLANQPRKRKTAAIGIFMLTPFTTIKFLLLLVPEKKSDANRKTRKEVKNLKIDSENKVLRFQKKLPKEENSKMYKTVVGGGAEIKLQHREVWGLNSNGEKFGAGSKDIFGFNENKNILISFQAVFAGASNEFSNPALMSHISVGRLNKQHFTSTAAKQKIFSKGEKKSSEQREKVLK